MKFSPEDRERVYQGEETRRETQEKSKAERRGKTTKYCWIACFGLIVLALISAALLPASKAKHESMDNMVAYVMAKKFIQKRLIAPSTAEFPSQVSNEGDVRVVKLAGGRYRVSAWLDAENSFGTRLRTKWACELKRTSADAWEITGFCDLVE